MLHSLEFYLYERMVTYCASVDFCVDDGLYRGNR